jgi:hypothetical protein
MVEKSNDSGKGTGRKNGLKCLNKLKKAYPNYIFGLANGRPYYRKTENSRNRKMSKTMEKICGTTKKSSLKSSRRKSRKRKTKSKSKPKSIKRKSKSKSRKRKSKCKKSSIKKYRSRPGPPYPAQNCQYSIRAGNDGNIYRSIPNKNGVFSWKKV